MNTSSQNHIALLNEMREHHKKVIDGTASGSVAPSTQELQDLYLKKAISKGASNDPQIRALQLNAETEGEKNTKNTENGITEATMKFEESGSSDTASYTDKLNKLRDRDKAASNKTIDKIYDDAIEVVEKDPSKGDAVVGAMDVIGKFFDNLFGQIGTFIMDIARNILSYLSEIWKKITNTFNSIVSWISGWF